MIERTIDLAEEITATTKCVITGCDKQATKAVIMKMSDGQHIGVTVCDECLKTALQAIYGAVK